MNRFRPTSTLSFARKLRRDQTDAERVLWRAIRSRQLFGAKFRRQYRIGPYIADFCCVERGLVIELDGGQHDIDWEKDGERTALLEAFGYQVLRFWDNEVLLNIEGVLARVSEALINTQLEETDA